MSDDIDDLDSPEDGYGVADGDATALPLFQEAQEGELPAFRWKRFFAALGLLALLVGFHAFSVSSWIKRETRPPSWDQSIHLEIAKDFQVAFSEGRWKDIFMPAPKPGMPPFPPLHYMLIRYAMDAPDPASEALWINVFYMAILCVSLFGLGRRAGGEWGGLAAAVLFSCMPEVQWLLRDQIIDLPLVAWVVSAYWALLASERFEHPGPSALFGVMFAAAMLTKWSAFSYFLPLIVFLFGDLREPRRRKHFFTAAFIAVLLCGPWYALNWAVLIPRLFQASSDNAVSVASLSGLFAYVRQMSLGMEFPLFAAGLVSLGGMARNERGRSDASTLVLWFVLSFIFWTIVPNRQLRYLLPALAPLILMITSTMKFKPLAALCALELIAAVNFSYGVLPHIHPGFLSFNASLFRADPPQKEDWPIGEILRTAQEMRDKSAPFANMALLANAERFNGATFNWESARRGISTVKMRGINNRVCEFAEFLLTKEGPLGPPSVVNQLPKVRKMILARGSWFDRGYREAARFPLPDGTDAVLYQRRVPKKPPFPPGKTHFDYLSDKHVTIEGAKLDLGGYDRVRGVYPRVAVRAERLVIRGLEVTGLEAEIEDFLGVSVVDPKDAGSAGQESLLLDMRLLRMKKLRIKAATVTEEAVAAFIKARVKNLNGVEISIEENVKGRADIGGVALAAEAALRVSDDGSGLEIRLEKLSVGGVALPVTLLGPVRRFVRKFAPDPELPFEIQVKTLTLSGGRLRIRG